MAKSKQSQTPAPDQAARFLELFASNQRSSGRLEPRTEKMHTEYRPLQVADFERHLEGKEGVGGVPILDDDNCKWAAIDIDQHDQDTDIPIDPIDKYIVENKLPLIPCRSKSGGVHAYLFLNEPQQASKVRMLMNRWAIELGHAGSEVFPKQNKLSVSGDGRQQLGNWINLPYMGAAQTNRYAVRDGKRLSVNEFLTLADKLKLNSGELRAHMGGGHPDAPPCVQKMFARGVAEGQRNEALFNIGVYLRKSCPAERYEAAAHEANVMVFKKPLPKGEAIRTIVSAKREDNKYRCQEEPLRSLCDRETCMTRKYGVSKAEYEALAQLADLPKFDALIRYTSDPVRWELTMDGIRIMLSTEQLMTWGTIRMAVAEKLMKVVPVIKQSEWDRMLSELMGKARIVEVPEEASTSGVIRQRLRDFAQKAAVNGKKPTAEDRQALLRGLPVAQIIDNELCVAFRAHDFIAYLKRIKAEELKGVNLWAAVRDMVHDARLRIAGGDDGYIRVWYMPMREVKAADPEAPEFKSEI